MRRISFSTAGVLLVLTLLVGLVGCTGEDAPDEPAGSEGSSETSSPSATARPEVPTSVSFGQIAGKLVKKQRRTTRRKVTRVVDRWFDNAYVDRNYPRRKLPHAFRGFTKDAARQARQRRGVMSNMTISRRINDVRVKRRELTIDVLAPRRKVSGATARVVLSMKFSGKIKRTDRVRGRLLLTPVGKGWQIFGFDMERDVVRRGK